MKALRRSFSEEQAGIGGDGDLDLSRQASDIHGLQIGWSAWEPSIIAEEQQPRCKGEAVLSAFGRGCEKTVDGSFVDAKDPDLSERGSILDEILQHVSSESNLMNLVFSFYTATDAVIERHRANREKPSISSPNKFALRLQRP